MLSSQRLGDVMSNLLNIVNEVQNRIRHNNLVNWYPPTTKVVNNFTYYARDLYPRVVEFWKAGLTHNYRMFDGANQSGKTSGAGYEVACHVTGLYPPDWPGKKLIGPSKWWVAGETNSDVKEIMQDRFIGPVDDYGTGLIPYKCLDFTSMTNTEKADTFIRTIRVKHFDQDGNQDGMSVVTFKSYKESRKSFQGLPRNIWLDEEPPLEILSECMARTTADESFMLIITFTPLQGWSPMLSNWLPGGWQTSGPIKINGEPSTSKYLVIQTVDDVPHITEKKKAVMYENYHPHVRDARLKGIPSLGSGAIYPIPKTEWTIVDREIPKHFRKLYGLDVGYNWTAAVWFAINPETGEAWIYSSYQKGETEPIGHAEVIRSRGLWIPGAIDSAANGRGQDGGESLINQYRALGLIVSNADKSVEAGIYSVWTGLRSGMIKVFASQIELITEIENYHRDEKGKIVKANDHRADALRYAWMTKQIARQEKPPGAVGRIDPRFQNQFGR